MVSSYPEVVVNVYRGPSVESRHQLVASVVDAEGREVARYGDPDFSTYWRSSAKPFQARPWVDGGTIDHFGWGDQEVAIICASHVGADVHATLVRRMLADIGLGEADLRCDRELKACHNCSGNHTGFLAGCRLNGWDTATYRAADHPAQRAALAATAEIGMAALAEACSDAPGRDLDGALRRLAAIGHSSGLDAATGFFYGATIWGAGAVRRVARTRGFHQRDVLLHHG